MKITLCTAIGGIGSIVAAWLGGWSSSLATLIIFMGADYVSGILVAGVFKKSTKTETGGLNSSVGWMGICKKIMILVFVLVGYRIDLFMEINYVKNAVIISFLANELISLTENAGLMGLPVPQPILRAIDVLTKKGDSDQKSEGR